MIIEYDEIYNENIKDLLVELQNHIVNIDKEGYNIITDEYKELYFNKTMEEINKYEGKIYLYKENNEILGLIVGLINNEDTSDYDFKAPKRGRVSELIVTQKIRSKGIGKQLLDRITQYFKDNNCKAILIEVFGYNETAINFYEKNGYHTRLIEMIKEI